MSTGATGARGLLQQARDQLVEREAKLAALAGELADTRAAIKTLRKHLGIKAPAQIPASTEPKTGGVSPRARFTEKVIDTIRERNTALSFTEIATLLDRPTDDEYLRSILDQALARGQLVDTPHGLAVPA